MAHSGLPVAPRSAPPPVDRAAAIMRTRQLPIVAALVAIVFGVAVVQGYVFGIEPLLPYTPFLPPTQPLVAVLFVLTGVSLLALRVGLSRLQLAGAWLATVLAGAVVAEYVLGLNLRLDQLLFPETVAALSPVFPGRPPPSTSATFLLLGLALLTVGSRPMAGPRHWHSAGALGAIVLPVMPIVGHLLGVSELYAFTPGIGTALHTALILLLLAAGVTAATHESAVVNLLVGTDPGTILLRRFLPLAVLLPLLFAAGSVLASRLGLYEAHIGMVFYTSAWIAMFVGVAYWMAAVTRRADAERRAADRAQAELALRDRLLQAETAAAEAARESERRTRELLDVLSHAPVFARGLDGRIRFWSAGAERLYGWASDQASRSLARDLLRTELPVTQAEADAVLLLAGEWHGELIRRARDGARVQVASHWILHRDQDGAPDAVIEVDNDVTEQRRVEEALRRGEARYRALVAATAQIVWTASADGKRPLDLSQWEAFTGQSVAEAEWGGWLRAIHPDDRAEATRQWNRAVRTRTPLLAEHRLRRKDGEYRHMEIRAVPVVDAQGAVREWVGAHADITERVKAQEQLGQAQKLQAVGTLAGGVAHEVNNQLMAVLGFGDFVLKELGPDHPQVTDVEEMIRGATRAAKVAQQLLTFSRRQVSQTLLLDVHAAIEALAPVLERLLGADKNLVILPRKTQHRVLADPTQVDDAMGTGGTLSLGIDAVLLDEGYARAHSVGRLIPGAYVRLTVSDTGIGMDRTTLAKIFEPFFTTKPMGAGTGLGLSTVYGIVKQHDGFIWAYSELGLGTTMKVYLPVARSEAAAESKPKPEAPAEWLPQLEPALILVVEDEAAVRHMVRRSLEGAGLTVLEAENGRRALELVATHAETPKLVVTDIIMPGLNGRELSEALSLTQPGMPVLFMSGYTGDDVLARSLLPPTAPFIQKPFAPEELVARVRQLLASGAVARR